MNFRNGFRPFAGSLALGFCFVLPLVVDAAEEAAEEAANTKKPWQCTLRLIDPDGKPVVGGKVTAYRKTRDGTPGMQVWESLEPVDPQISASDERRFPQTEIR